MKIEKKVVEINNHRDFSISSSLGIVLLLLFVLAFYAIHSWVEVRKFQATSNYAVGTSIQLR